GLDSRMVLAAIPAGMRRGMLAVTVGPEHGDDQRIAAQLARRYGLDHRRVTHEGLIGLEPEQSLQLACAAAAARDCTGNPTALAVLDWQERSFEQRPRLTGQNGEFARGFYYAGQRAHAATTERLVDALARWRAFTNDAVDASLFVPGFL